MGKGVRVGLNELHYAILTKDDDTGVTYLAPVKIAGAINAKISPKSNLDILYADDGPSEIAFTMGVVDVEIEQKDLDLDTQAALLGHTVVGGVLIKKASDLPPWLALGFKSKKSNGNYRYLWLFKGKFSLPEEDYETLQDKSKFQTPKIKGTFIKRDYDTEWEKVTDEDHANYVASIGTNWFTVVEGAADTVAPTVASVVPANNALGVAVGASVVWTFSEAIQASTVIGANFMLQKADGSAQVAGTLSIDATKTIVTFVPAANLAAATQYMAIATVGVKDLAGNALAAPSVTKFTTA